TTATFRTYATALDSFRDHAVFLRTNRRYRPAFAYTADADQFLYQIWLAGYATSPTYVDNVQAVMRQWQLYRFDLELPAAKGPPLPPGRAPPPRARAPPPPRPPRPGPTPRDTAWCCG